MIESHPMMVADPSICIACFNPTKVPVTKEIQFSIGILCIIQTVYVIETCPMMAADPSIRIACCNPTKVPVTKEMQLFQHCILCIIQKIYMIESRPKREADPSIRMAVLTQQTHSCPRKRSYFSIGNPKNLYDRLSTCVSQALVCCVQYKEFI